MKKLIPALLALLLISACGRLPPTSEVVKNYCSSGQVESVQLDSLAAADYYRQLEAKFASLSLSSPASLDSQANVVSMPPRNFWAVLNQIRYRYSIQKTRYEQVSWLEFRIVNPAEGIDETIRFSYPAKARCGTLRYSFSSASYRTLPSETAIISRFEQLLRIMGQIDNASVRVDG